MPASDPCKERHALYLKLYVAVERFTKPKERYAAAKERNAANASEPYDMLAQARETERALAQALRNHSEQHGCVH